MKLFLRFASQEFSASAMYRFEFWMELASNMIAMYGVYWLWTTLYRQRPEQIGASLEQMITYAMLAVLLNTLLDASSLPRYYISHQVRTGAIEMDLLRPLGFPFHLLARSTGQMIFLTGAHGVPGVLLGALLLGLQAPASLAHARLFLVSLALAFLVGFSLNFLVGLSSGYTIGFRRISWMYNAVVRFFSGQMVPLWIFPALLAQIAALLPFQSMVSIPLSIYIGRLSIAEALQAMGLQALWAAALLVVVQFAWGRAYAHLTVQGG